MIIVCPHCHNEIPLMNAGSKTVRILFGFISGAKMKRTCLHCKKEFYFRAIVSTEIIGA